MARKKRETPGLNSSSTADMAFILLIFFLITTSMDTDKGLARRLPPPLDPSVKNQDNVIVKVYTKWISDSFAKVSTAEEFNKAIARGKGIYLMNDLDFAGKEFYNDNGEKGCSYARIPEGGA